MTRHYKSYDEKTNTVKINNIYLLTEQNLNDNTTYFDKNGVLITKSISVLEKEHIVEERKKYQELNYKDVLRYPDNYSKQKVYWFGEIVQIIDKDGFYTTLRVNVNCEKLKYIDNYMCRDTIYVSYFGDNSFIENDIVEIWGIMDGTETYTSVIGTRITIPKVLSYDMELYN